MVKVDKIICCHAACSEGVAVQLLGCWIARPHTVHRDKSTLTHINASVQTVKMHIYCSSLCLGDCILGSVWKCWHGQCRAHPNTAGPSTLSIHPPSRACLPFCMAPVRRRVATCHTAPAKTSAHTCTHQPSQQIGQQQQHQSTRTMHARAAAWRTAGQTSSVFAAYLVHRALHPCLPCPCHQQILPQPAECQVRFSAAVQLLSFAALQPEHTINEDRKSRHAVVRALRKLGVMD